MPSKPQSRNNHDLKFTLYPNILRQIMSGVDKFVNLLSNRDDKLLRTKVLV
jgi:hypothetical protein